MSVGRSPIVDRVVALAIAAAGALTAQQPADPSTEEMQIEFTTAWPVEIAVGEEWSATAEGCTGSVVWSAPGGEPATGNGDEFTTVWSMHGTHDVSVACDAGAAEALRVFVLDGTPFVEVGEILNPDEARIGFEGRLYADAVYGDAPLGTIFRLVLYRRGSPVPSGGRSEVVSRSSGVARVDAYCLSPGPIHEVQLVLEDQSTGVEIADSERLKVRDRKLRCQ